MSLRHVSLLVNTPIRVLNKYSCVKWYRPFVKVFKSIFFCEVVSSICEQL